MRAVEHETLVTTSRRVLPVLSIGRVGESTTITRGATGEARFGSHRATELGWIAREDVRDGAVTR